MSRRSNALIAGSAAGAATALATPGAIGVAAGGKAFKIPVLTQVLALGAVAAVTAAAASGSKTAKRHLPKVIAMSFIAS